VRPLADGKRPKRWLGIFSAPSAETVDAASDTSLRMTSGGLERGGNRGGTAILSLDLASGKVVARKQ